MKNRNNADCLLVGTNSVDLACLEASECGGACFVCPGGLGFGSFGRNGDKCARSGGDGDCS